MALADFAAYRDALRAPHSDSLFNIGSTTAAAGRWYAPWATLAPAGAVPTSAVVPTSATLGANGSEGNNGVIGGRVNAMNPGVVLLCDKLSHQGGLSGVTTGAQTTNLPTAALTRYTSAVGVMCMLNVYTQIGTTATTVTVSYTNQAGTGGQTSPAVVIGGTGFREVPRAILIPLAAGDTGFQSVESVTIAATTGTAGNFGVTLFKPITAMIADEQHGVAVCGLISGRMVPGFAELDGTDPCLFMMAMSQSTNIMAAGAVLLTEW